MGFTFLTLASHLFCILIYGKVECLYVEYEYLHHHKYVACYNAPMHIIQIVNALLK
jgi:hypothetical protein